MVAVTYAVVFLVLTCRILLLGLNVLRSWVDIIYLEQTVKTFKLIICEMKKKQSCFSISAGHRVLGSIQVPTPGKTKANCDQQVCTFLWLGGGLSSHTPCEDSQQG